MTAVRAVSPPLLTVEEFFNWSDAEPGVKYELVDGVPCAMAPAAPVHGLIQANVARKLGNHLDARGKRCPVLTEAGVIPRGGADMNLRIPDVTVTCAPLRREDRVVKAPLLLVEVLSPGNEHVTQANVWSYMSIPAVQEILLLRTDRIQAEILTREADREWPETRRVYLAGSLVTLASVDLICPVEDFYAFTYLLDADPLDAEQSGDSAAVG